MVRRVYIAVALLAATLGGCSGYATFDPESTSATFFSSTSTNHNPASVAGAAGKKDAATLNALFASATQGPIQGPTQGRSDDRTMPAAELASAADFAGEPSPTPPKETLEPRGRAYLFRGVAGLIYSRGMDSLAERIRLAGIPASVQTYLTWRGAADQAIQDYRRDPAPITLIGHSMGGDAALSFAGALNAENIPVSLLVTYDPTRIADNVPPNVERYINIYQSSNIMGGGNVVQGSHFHGHYVSFNLKYHSEIIHINIEKAERIQEQLVGKIAQLAATSASAQGDAVPLRLEVPGDAAVELWDSGLPVQAHASDTLKSLAATYRVPLWALAEINSVSARAVLAEGQRVIIPRHLAPIAVPGPITSYAATGR
jgi:hypothetical protein